MASFRQRLSTRACLNKEPARGVIILLMSWTASGCGEAVSFRTIDQGFYSGYQERAAFVVRTAEQWQQVWERHSAVLTPRPTPPSIDFEHEMVIAIFLGERPTGGFTVEVNTIDQRPDALSVLVEETIPDPDAMVTQAITSPYHLVRLKRSDLPVEFETRTVPAAP